MQAPLFRSAENLDFTELAARAADQVVSDEELLYQLIQARKAAGLTQRGLAELLGIKQPSVAKFERHDSDPRLSTIRKYALAVGAHIHHGVVPAESATDPLAAWTSLEPQMFQPVKVEARMISPSANPVGIDAEYESFIESVELVA